MTCRQLSELLIEYRSGGLPPEERKAFEVHLTQCARCVEYLRSYEDTIRLARDAFADPDAPVPPTVPAELVQAIVAARRRTPHR